MNKNVIIKWMMAGALGLSALAIEPAGAQSTLGGAKTQQNKVGSAAKPAPALGGAIHTPSPPAPPKPGPVVGTAKQNPPATSPNKGKPAVSASSNLKCASGACTSKGMKP